VLVQISSAKRLRDQAERDARLRGATEVTVEHVVRARNTLSGIQTSTSDSNLEPSLGKHSSQQTASQIKQQPPEPQAQKTNEELGEPI
jgi:hypothetical protein